MSTGDDGQYDLTDAGFDGFLSRSVDQTPAINLDSVQPANNALPFDRTQVTGSQGDTYNLGGISMSAQDNAMTLNDGILNINDSSTGSNIQAQSGNITYFDSTGNLVVQEGLLPDGATGIRIVDKQQIGLAQFGRFKDGTTALKIAKPNVEVSTALDSQLIFNSSQDIFKIIKSGTTSGTVSDGAQSLVITIPHLLNIIPAVVAFVQFPAISAISAYTAEPPYGGGYTSMPYTQQFHGPSGTDEDWFPWLTMSYEVDVSNLTLRAYRHITGTGAGTDTISFRYYILQETAN